MNFLIIIETLKELTERLETYDACIRKAWVAEYENNHRAAKELGVNANYAWRDVQILKQKLKYEGFTI
jgi:hypothetical protein